MKYKLFIAVGLILSLVICGLKNTTPKDEIRNSPFQVTNSAMCDGKIYFVLNGVMQYFDEQTQQLDCVCDIESCSHDDASKDVCKAFVGAGTVLGSDGNSLYAFKYDLCGNVYQIDINDFSQKFIASIHPKYAGAYPIYPIFVNGNCYYITEANTINDYPIQIQSVSLTNDFYNESNRYPEPNIIWSSQEINGNNSFCRVKHLSTYGEYIYWVEICHSTDEIYNRIYTYNYRTEKLQFFDVENVEYVAMHNGNIMYIDIETETINVIDISKNKLNKTFEMKECLKGMTIACDDDYLYLNYQNAFYENMELEYPQTNYYKVDIYTLSGEYITQIDLSNVTENSMCAQYLCSSENYVFLGESNGPQTRELYIIDKDFLLENQTINIFNLYKK